MTQKFIQGFKYKEWQRKIQRFEKKFKFKNA